MRCSTEKPHELDETTDSEEGVEELVYTFANFDATSQRLPTCVSVAGFTAAEGLSRAIRLYKACFARHGHLEALIAESSEFDAEVHLFHRHTHTRNLGDPLLVGFTAHPPRPENGYTWHGTETSPVGDLLWGDDYIDGDPWTVPLEAPRARCRRSYYVTEAFLQLPDDAKAIFRFRPHALTQSDAAATVATIMHKLARAQQPGGSSRHLRSQADGTLRRGRRIVAAVLPPCRDTDQRPHARAAIDSARRPLLKMRGAARVVYNYYFPAEKFPQSDQQVQ